MDKLLKLLVGNHQESSLAGYLLLGFSLWQQYHEQFSPLLALVGVGLFFILRFTNERLPGVDEVLQAVLRSLANRGVVSNTTGLANAPPARHQPTPYEQQLMREVETLRGQRDAVIEDAAKLRQNLDYSNRQVEAHRANTSTRVDALPLGDDVLGRG